MIFVVATAHKGVDGDGFHKVALPAASDNVKFLYQYVIEEIHRKWDESLPSIDGDREVECTQYTNDSQRVGYCNSILVLTR
jgi:hypothetical protein